MLGHVDRHELPADRLAQRHPQDMQAAPRAPSPTVAVQHTHQFFDVEHLEVREGTIPQDGQDRPEGHDIEAVRGGSHLTTLQNAQ